MPDEIKPEELPSCATCKFFSPAHYGIGECLRQYSPGSKMFTKGDNAKIFVVNSFLCEHHTIDEPRKETL